MTSADEVRCVDCGKVTMTGDMARHIEKTGLPSVCRECDNPGDDRMSRQHASLTIEFASRQALEEYVYNLADAGLIPDGADVFPRDALDGNRGDYLIRSTNDGRINGILGRKPETEEGT